MANTDHLEKIVVSDRLKELTKNKGWIFEGRYTYYRKVTNTRSVGHLEGKGELICGTVSVKGTKWDVVWLHWEEDQRWEIDQAQSKAMHHAICC